MSTEHTLIGRRVSINCGVTEARSYGVVREVRGGRFGEQARVDVAGTDVWITPPVRPAGTPGIGVNFDDWRVETDATDEQRQTARAIALRGLEAGLTLTLTHERLCEVWDSMRDGVTNALAGRPAAHAICGLVALALRTLGAGAAVVAT